MAFHGVLAHLPSPKNAIGGPEIRVTQHAHTHAYTEGGKKRDAGSHAYELLTQVQATARTPVILTGRWLTGYIEFNIPLPAYLVPR